MQIENSILGNLKNIEPQAMIWQWSAVVARAADVAAGCVYKCKPVKWQQNKTNGWLYYQDMELQGKKYNKTVLGK